MANLPAKPTKIPAPEVLQYTVQPDGAGGYELKTNAQLSGSIEVNIDAVTGDNIALADGTTGNKAAVDDNKLNVKDTAVKTSVDSLGSGITGINTKIDTTNTKLDTIATNQSGQATAANQTSTNTKLDTIATNQGSQATAANQTSTNTKLDTVITNQAGQATSANQSSTNTKLDTVNTNLGTIDTDIKAAQPRKIQDGAGNALTSSTVNSRQALDVHQADTSFIVSGLTAVGVAPSLNPISVSGTDGGGLKRHLLTDAAGVLQAAITSSTLPTNASTAANQTSTNTKLDTIATNQSGQATAANQTSTNTKLDTVNTNLGTNNTLTTSSNTKLDTIATNQAGQSTAANQTSTNTKLDTIATNQAGQSTAANQTSTNTKLDTVNTNLGTNNTLTTSSNTKLDTVNTSVVANKPALRPGVDWDSRTMTLSAVNTVETWVHKLATVTITKGTYTVTFTDSTRTVVVSETWT